MTTDGLDPEAFRHLLDITGGDLAYVAVRATRTAAPAQAPVGPPPVGTDALEAFVAEALARASRLTSG